MPILWQMPCEALYVISCHVKLLPYAVSWFTYLCLHCLFVAGSNAIAAQLVSYSTHQNIDSPILAFLLI